MDYTLKGTEELMLKLNKVQGGMLKGLEAAVAAGALLVVNGAKIKCPFVTGTLKRSIHIGGFTSLVPDYDPGDSRNTKTFGDIGKGKKTDTSVELKVGTNLEYAKKIEYGGSQKAPQGYLRPAMDENKDKIPKEIQAALWDIIKKVA